MAAMRRRQNRRRTFGWRAQARSPQVHNETVAYARARRRAFRSAVRGFHGLGRTMRLLGRELARASVAFDEFVIAGIRASESNPSGLGASE